MKKISVILIGVLCISLLTSCGDKTNTPTKDQEIPEVLSSPIAVDEEADVEIEPYRTIKYNEKYTSKYFLSVDEAKSYLVSVGVPEEFIKLINGNEILNSADNIKKLKEEKASEYDGYKFYPLVDSKSKESVLQKNGGDIVVTIDAKVTALTRTGEVQASAVFAKGSSSIQYIINGIEDVKVGDVVQVTGVFNIETNELKVISTYKY